MIKNTPSDFREHPLKLDMPFFYLNQILKFICYTRGLDSDIGLDYGQYGPEIHIL